MTAEQNIGHAPTDRKRAGVHAVSLGVDPRIAAWAEDTRCGADGPEVDRSEVLGLSIRKLPPDEFLGPRFVGRCLSFDLREEVLVAHLPRGGFAEFDGVHGLRVRHRPDTNPALGPVAGDEKTVAAPRASNRIRRGHSVILERDRRPATVVIYQDLVVHGPGERHHSPVGAERWYPDLRFACLLEIEDSKRWCLQTGLAARRSSPHMCPPVRGSRSRRPVPR